MLRTTSSSRPRERSKRNGSGSGGGGGGGSSVILPNNDAAASVPGASATFTNVVVYRPVDDRVALMLLDPRPAGRGILLQQHLGLHKGRETVVVVGFGILRVVLLLRLHGCRCLEEGSRHLSTLLIFHCSCGPLLLNHTRNRRRILLTLHFRLGADTDQAEALRREIIRLLGLALATLARVEYGCALRVWQYCYCCIAAGGDKIY